MDILAYTALFLDCQGQYENPFISLFWSGGSHKVRHPRCVYNKLDWSLCTCLTQLYGGIDMYNLLHKELHVSALFIGHIQVDN